MRKDSGAGASRFQVKTRGEGKRRRRGRKRRREPSRPFECCIAMRPMDGEPRTRRVGVDLVRCRTGTL